VARSLKVICNFWKDF